MTDLGEFIDALPKVDLHVHLLGAASPRTVAGLARRHPESGVPQSEQELEEFYTFRDFRHFVEVYDTITDLVVDPEDIAALVLGAARDLAAQNGRYMELTVTPYSHVRRGLPMAAVTEALDLAAREAQRSLSLRVAYIFDIAGEAGEEGARGTIDHALAHPPEALVGFGLAGLETARARHRDAFRDAFRAAVGAGLHSVPHAGETSGSETIWEAIEGLAAERIGHGIHCLDDPRLVSHLRQQEIPLEVCPTSNVRTRQVADLAQHPFARLLEAGLTVTVNSDDPPMFGTTLTAEYHAVAQTFRLDRATLTQLATNAIKASFLPTPEKTSLLAEIATLPSAARTAKQDESGS